MTTKIKMPKHLKRAMTADEVEELWLALYNESEDAQRRFERCFTKDKTGILILHQQECTEQQHRMNWLNHARHWLVSILAKETR